MPPRQRRGGGAARTAGAALEVIEESDGEGSVGGDSLFSKGVPGGRGGDGGEGGDGGGGGGEGEGGGGGGGDASGGGGGDGGGNGGNGGGAPAAEAHRDGGDSWWKEVDENRKDFFQAWLCVLSLLCLVFAPFDRNIAVDVSLSFCALVALWRVTWFLRELWHESGQDPQPFALPKLVDGCVGALKAGLSVLGLFLEAFVVLFCFFFIIALPTLGYFSLVVWGPALVASYYVFFQFFLVNTLKPVLWLLLWPVVKFVVRRQFPDGPDEPDAPIPNAFPLRDVPRVFVFSSFVLRLNHVQHRLFSVFPLPGRWLLLPLACAGWSLWKGPIAIPFAFLELRDPVLFVFSTWLLCGLMLSPTSRPALFSSLFSVCFVGMFAFREHFSFSVSNPATPIRLYLLCAFFILVAYWFAKAGEVVKLVPPVGSVLLPVFVLLVFLALLHFLSDSTLHERPPDLSPSDWVALRGDVLALNATDLHSRRKSSLCCHASEEFFKSRSFSFLLNFTGSRPPDEHWRKAGAPAHVSLHFPSFFPSFSFCTNIFWLAGPCCDDLPERIGILSLCLAGIPDHWEFIKEQNTLDLSIPERLLFIPIPPYVRFALSDFFFLLFEPYHMCRHQFEALFLCACSVQSHPVHPLCWKLEKLWNDHGVTPPSAREADFTCSPGGAFPKP